MADGLDGLEGVIAAETVLSDVDGAASQLLIRGHSLDALAGGGASRRSWACSGAVSFRP